MAPSSWQGVTTVVMGNCGVGFAPVRPDAHGWLIELMEGVEDIPGTALHEGITWDWESFPEYLDAVGSHAVRARHRRAGPPRRAARLRDGRARRRPHRDAVDRRDRADGRARGRGHPGRRARLLHLADRQPQVARAARTRRRSPRPPTSCSASPGRSARPGSGVFEVVADLDDLDGEFALIRAMSEVSGRPTSLTVLQKPGPRPDDYRRVLAPHRRRGGRRRAHARPGPDPSRRPDHEPRGPGQPVRRVTHLPGARRPVGRPSAWRALRDPAVRAQVVAESEARAAVSPLTHFGAAFALGDPPVLRPRARREHPRRSRQRAGRSVFDVALDVMLADGGNGKLYLPVMNYADGTMARHARDAHQPELHPRPRRRGRALHADLRRVDADVPAVVLGARRAPRPSGCRSSSRCSARPPTPPRSSACTTAACSRPGMRADLNVIDFDALLDRHPPDGARPPRGREAPRPAGVAATAPPSSPARSSTATARTPAPAPARLVRGAQPAPA